MSKEDEQVIAKLVDDVAEWGFPLGRFEIKLMVKDLLDSRNVVSRFKGNFSGLGVFVIVTRCPRGQHRIV